MVDFRREIEKPEYDFLRENDHLAQMCVCLRSAAVMLMVQAWKGQTSTFAVAR